MMERQAVESTHLKSIGYDSANQVLEIEFLEGSIYHYFQVPPDVYAGLISAESHGQYFDKYIKKESFVYMKIS
jgi:hypothetical protein